MGSALGGGEYLKGPNPNFPKNNRCVNFAGILVGCSYDGYCIYNIYGILYKMLRRSHAIQQSEKTSGEAHSGNAEKTDEYAAKDGKLFSDRENLFDLLSVLILKIRLKKSFEM